MVAFQNNYPSASPGCPNLTDTWPDLGSVLVRLWPFPSQFWATLTNFGPHSVNSRPISSDFGPPLVDAGQAWLSSPAQTLDPFRAKSGRCRRSSAQWSNSAPTRPGKWKCGRSRADLRAPKLGFGQASAPTRPTRDRLRANLADVGGTGLGPTLSGSDSRPGVGQLLAICPHLIPIRTRVGI